LAVVDALVLLQHFFWQIIVFAVLSVGLYVLWDNLRELGR
jgi:membrane protein implicated in regulation of membrane protease activity